MVRNTLVVMTPFRGDTGERHFATLIIESGQCYSVSIKDSAHMLRQTNDRVDRTFLPEVITVTIAANAHGTNVLGKDILIAVEDVPSAGRGEI